MLSWNLYPKVATPNVCHSSLPGVTFGSGAISEVLIQFSSLAASLAVCLKSTPFASNLLVQEELDPAD